MLLTQQIRNAVRRDRHLVKNFVALGLVQATNFIIPLVNFPYLMRAVGAEKFGVIAYGLTVLNYFIAFTDYGFNLSATRQVAIHRDDRPLLSQLFSAVTVTKLLLFGVTIATMAILCLLVPRFNQDALAYMLGLLFVLGNVLMPVWFFQGMEQMKYITYVNLIAKVALLGLIVLLVQRPADYIYVLGLYGAANILSGLHSFYLIRSRYRLTVYWPGWQAIKTQLKEGWYVFLSNFSIMLTSNLNVLLLGFFVTNTTIGYYSIAEKIVFAMWSLLSLFSQVIYPHVCRLAQDSHARLQQFLRTTFAPLLIGTVLVAIGVYAYADEIIRLVAGTTQAEAAHVLRLMSFVPVLVCLNIPPYQTLLAYNQQKLYVVSFNISAVANLIISPLLIFQFGVLGAALSLMLIQLLITLSLYYTLEAKRPAYSLFKRV
ncbi:flippase [Spirosoma taeanense]|uniref:Flippase n=1 Tax=Spirosoma taeanense TaxID=2735870 RepID=A0A6M5Y515_9BACT|nr:flippase [Spirosoma taeanense]QJW88301.1 flippase [Spirosoma taeanense]